MPGGETAAHEPGHRPQDGTFTGVGASLADADQVPAAQEPGEGPLHDPAAGQGLETLGVVAATNDVKSHPRCWAAPVGEVAGVTAVGPDAGKAPEPLFACGQQDSGGVPVGRGRGRDQDVQDESKGVGKRMPPAIIDLADVEAP